MARLVAFETFLPGLKGAVKKLVPPAVYRPVRIWWQRRQPIRDDNRRSLTPISRDFGFDRGLCIDRYYIEGFLQRHGADIRGRVLEVLDRQPILDPAALGLLRWAAEYYHHPLGEVVAAAMPKALRLGASTSTTEERWSVTADGHDAHQRGEPKRAPKQRKLLEFLAAHDAASADVLTEQVPNWREAARQLVARGWIESIEVSPETKDSPIGRIEGPPLSEEQKKAVEVVGEVLNRYGTFVLHGVTGSGKTEVYLRLVERVLAQGRRALVLVPEIGLTPQLVGRFRQRLDVPMAVLHSALTDHERLRAWREAFSGRAKIVLGTRSAVFAPVPDLGIIIVDEEHDSSFKQHEGGFRYSARDLAVVRAQRADVPVMLGSATPALETLNNVTTSRYVRLTLPRREDQAAPPRMALVDLRAHAVHAGISTPAVQAMERHIKEDGQVLVFLNRRGYAPTLLCTACGWVAPCSECDARLTVHLSASRLRCHHCGADGPLPTRCPQCGFAVKPVGQGTERIEETLGALFPGVSLVRLDRDVVRKRGDMEEAMRRMASGEARILIGTQMVTKGHDFPNVTLVVVLNADQGLFSSDFRAPERLAQTIVQVAGRAGRGTRPGEVARRVRPTGAEAVQFRGEDGVHGRHYTGAPGGEECSRGSKGARRSFPPVERRCFPETLLHPHQCG